MMAIHVLPQHHGRFHVDEAGVFAQIPVRVVGDPPLSVIGIDYFPGRKDASKLVDKSESSEGRNVSVVSDFVHHNISVVHPPTSELTR